MLSLFLEWRYVNNKWKVSWGIKVLSLRVHCSSTGQSRPTHHTHQRHIRRWDIFVYTKEAQNHTGSLYLIKFPFPENWSSRKLSINHIFWLIIKPVSTYGERWLKCFFYKLILGWCLYQRRYYVRSIHIHNFLKTICCHKHCDETSAIYRALIQYCKI